MIAAHQQITDETGATFVMLPLEEYERLLEDAWHRRVLEQSRGEESVKTTIDELKHCLGSSLGSES
jgi:hypothetical protein